MSESFDAYHKWLAIPPSEQPPNHYRLLGLSLFESDPEVIAIAADRQMSHVQTYKNGPRAELSQTLLNEIATAKLCLLKPQRKEAYDCQLRERLVGGPFATAKHFPSSMPASAESRPVAPWASMPPAPVPPPAIAAPPPIDQLADEADRPTWNATTMLAAAAVVIALLILAVWAVIEFGQGRDSSRRLPPSAALESREPQDPAKPTSASDTVTRDGQ
jgi:hypothetical protein